MKYQPNRNYVSNDLIETPEWLARALVDYFKPSGRVLEPCKEGGRIYDLLPKGAEWCEIERGRDFLTFPGSGYDWILTNPPWSQVRPFLLKSMQVAENVVFLMTINYIWTAARLRELKKQGFGIKAIVLVPMPICFPQSGFRLGAIHFLRKWTGPISMGEIDAPPGMARRSAALS